MALGSHCDLLQDGPGAGIRTVLPSTAITFRLLTTRVRVHGNAPITRSRRSASRRTNTRRFGGDMVECRDHVRSDRIRGVWSSAWW